MDRSAVTGVVVEVGPATVRGPNHADAEWVSAGIDAIDDELTLIDECPIGVAAVWRTIMSDVVGGCTETMVVVCPTWWSSSRAERVREAASAVADDVVVLRRAHVLPGRSTVVEIAPEFLVVSVAGGDMHVVARDDLDALLAKVPRSMTALLDGPEGHLVEVIADRLRANGVEVTIGDDDWVRRSVEELQSDGEAGEPEPGPSKRRGGRATAVLAGTLVSAAVLGGGFAARHDVAPSSPMTLLVEGRVGVMVPARWAVQRVTSGPGSARVQVVSPDDAHVAVHITQSSLASGQSYEQVAQSLRSALSQEPEGVFVGFNPSDRRADRAVVSYRELRADHHIAWVVLIDKTLRIAIGCQSPPGHDEAVRDICDQAIRSAHAVF